jgi:predicted nucleotidyltransferase
MHPTLKAIYDSTVEQFRQDPRIVAAWEFGSIGKGTADEFSDVDPVFVVKDEFFDEVDEERRPLLEEIGFRIALWWPDRLQCTGH